MAMRDGDPRIPGAEKTWRPLPVIATIVVILAVLVMGYNFGHQPSHSEKYGTVTETEAADGVRPSLAPDAGSEPSSTSGTVTSEP
ncbi:conserved hypothetical protein [Hyphomicrobium denitrificans ATCC 51888]|uniref:Uncharacterized protein n=1 Tax=Hyphomicrobium denitrificans (strain ATCC 51888 / DSM 1869 / NCIMB 11706 / TK 0415) TaxID=582899 RepID=D8JUF7_HYPDA|nr:hypothetical protein [Hyphomicrobium denitrificans]ADJ22747.1 conserved hypothetical protein [Hyphomicrobium denitrificans ATCC 51888]